MIILVARWIPAAAMALFPFVLIKNKNYLKDPILLNHEAIHVRQQIELLILPFYIIYLANYLANLLIYRSHQKAYRNILFEREAYGNEKNLNYISQRKFFGWIYQ